MHPYMFRSIQRAGYPVQINYTRPAVRQFLQLDKVYFFFFSLAQTWYLKWRIRMSIIFIRDPDTNPFSDFTIYGYAKICFEWPDIKSDPEEITDFEHNRISGQFWIHICQDNSKFISRRILDLEKQNKKTTTKNGYLAP